jgi:hypothetical protein
LQSLKIIKEKAYNQDRPHKIVIRKENLKTANHNVNLNVYQQKNVAGQKKNSLTWKIRKEPKAIIAQDHHKNKQLHHILLAKEVKALHLEEMTWIKMSSIRTVILELNNKYNNNMITKTYKGTTKILTKKKRISTITGTTHLGIKLINKRKTMPMFLMVVKNMMSQTKHMVITKNRMKFVKKSNKSINQLRDLKRGKAAKEG